MAPSHSRQLLVWTFPTIAILLSYLWFKRKRIGVRSDPGGINVDNSEERLLLPCAEAKGIVEETPVEIPQQQSSAKATPEKKFSRSLSGVETAPIDIIIPRELRSVKSNPVVISDEDLDLEIEKIKSMKNETFKKSRALNSSTTTTTTTTSSSKEDVNEKTPPKQNSETPVKKVETTSIKTTEKTTPNKTVERKLDMVEKKVEAAGKMAQDMVRVEQKLNNLKLGMNNSQSSKKKGKKGGNKGGKNVKLTSEREELQRQSSERDSANHSPADVMLASPSLSSISDNHSEVSTKSTSKRFK